MKVFEFDHIKIDEKNPNKHTKKGMKLIEKSLRELGFGRPIVIDKKNRIICGNGVFETVVRNKLFGKVRVIETKGDEVVVHKRVDLDLDEERGRKLSIIDNWTGFRDLNFDTDVLRSYDFDLKEWEITIPRFEEEGGYKIDIGEIIYEPRAESKPEVDELYDASKYVELIQKIEGLDVDEKMKEFLRLAAARFVDFRFDKIAEYYAWVNDEKIKRIFEDLVLVILDVDGAIERGLVETWGSYEEMYENEE